MGKSKEHFERLFRENVSDEEFLEVKQLLLEQVRKGKVWAFRLYLTHCAGNLNQPGNQLPQPAAHAGLITIQMVETPKRSLEDIINVNPKAGGGSE